MSNIEWIFIDLDGTLVDSIPFLKEIFFKYISNSEKDFENNNGKPIESFVTNEKKIQYHSLLIQYYQSEVKAFPEALKCLEFLKSKKKKLALVTSASEEISSLCLKTIHAEDYFTYIFNFNGKISKPNPKIYLEILQKLNIHQSHALAIEDSLNGVKASIEAGIVTYHLFCAGKNRPLIKYASNWKDLLTIFKKEWI